MLVLRKVKQLLSNFEAEIWENLSNLRLTKKSVAYKKNSSVALFGFIDSQMFCFFLLQIECRDRCYSYCPKCLRLAMVQKYFCFVLRKLRKQLQQ